MGTMIEEPTFSDLAAQLGRVVNGDVSLSDFNDQFMLEYFDENRETLPSWNRVFHILAEPGTDSEILAELAVELRTGQLRFDSAEASGVEITGSRYEEDLNEISLR